jgi:hypothetical protein
MCFIIIDEQILSCMLKQETIRDSVVVHVQCMYNAAIECFGMESIYISPS